MDRGQICALRSNRKIAELNMNRKTMPQIQTDLVMRKIMLWEFVSSLPWNPSGTTLLPKCKASLWVFWIFRKLKNALKGQRKIQPSNIFLCRPDHNMKNNSLMDTLFYVFLSFNSERYFISKSIFQYYQIQKTELFCKHYLHIFLMKQILFQNLYFISTKYTKLNYYTFFVFILK